ncbi:MAG: antibiotic biosynthesis monooxygenase [Candidatus Eremiobacteraeota bacterium]|nr:antibiotic biosynthesis monooxygenase [Candidatus Eremiobacteraeota bacterium]MBC5802088.1 antibiotic biosynthesis monooxygenase [Candidatus Eremiobacteraeota bacterium]MBC5822803.1 antibiotic biosynthesis monooxygenase [Candidatus Eremiobacteraeota bacterium]
MQLLRAVSIPDYRRVPGNLGAYVLRRDTEHVAHFETLSVWVCETAIEQYAGEHIRRPKYYDFDREYLLEFEQWVTHFRSAYDLERPRTF